MAMGNSTRTIIRRLDYRNRAIVGEGEFTALMVAHNLGRNFEIRMGLVDPVDTGRPHHNVKIVERRGQIHSSRYPSALILERSQPTYWRVLIIMRLRGSPGSLGLLAESYLGFRLPVSRIMM